MAEQKEKVSQEDIRREQVVYELAHTVLVSCEQCRVNVHWLDLMGERLHTGGWMLTEREFVREAYDGEDVYSYFCPEGHFTDGRDSSPALQAALHTVFSDVIEPIPVLHPEETPAFENVYTVRAQFRPTEPVSTGQYL